MYKTTRRSRAGFTLIELLTVIAIIGILAAILFPAIGAAKKAAQKANDLSNIRSLGQAALIYSSDNNDRLPDPSNTSTNTLTNGSKYKQWFGLLAKAGNLSDPSILMSKIDPLYPTTTITGILDPTDTSKKTLDTNLADDIQFTPSYEVVGGLKASDPSSTPIAFTRGIKADGTWDTTAGTYGSEGGMIVFIGGNVTQFKSIGTPSSLIIATGTSAGAVTVDIRKSIPFVSATGAQKIYGSGTLSNGGVTLGGPNGTPSSQ